jgi:hypothetical protein
MNYPLRYEIQRDYDIDIVEDYVNVSQMSIDEEKQISDWLNDPRTTRYINLLCNDPRFTFDILVRRTLSDNDEINIWLHHTLAINFAQWIDHDCDMHLRECLDNSI